MTLEEPKTGLVKIGTCDSQVEANYLKKFFEENGVYCFIQGESDSLLGAASGVVAMTIMVPGAQSEDAVGLLAETRLARQKGHTVKENMDFENVIAFPSRRQREKRRASAVVPESGPRRKKIWLAAVLAFSLPIGFGHLYAGAYARFALFLAGQLAVVDKILELGVWQNAWWLAAVPVVDAVGAVAEISRRKKC